VHSGKVLRPRRPSATESIAVVTIVFGVACGRLAFDPRVDPSGDAAGADGALAVPAVMQTRTWSNFASGTAQTLGATQVGTLLAVAIDVNSSTQVVSSVTDDTGDVFVSANVASTSLANPGGSVITEIWYATEVAGGATRLTVTTNAGAALWDVTVLEISNIDTASPLDAAAAISNVPGATTASDGPPLMTARANTTVVMLNAATGVIGLTAGSPFQNIATGGNDNVAHLAGAHPAGTYQATWVCSAPCGEYNVSAVGFAAR
jgi:hypothetical protein